MKDFTYKLTLKEKTEQEADNKMDALLVLASKLNTAELSKLAGVVKNDPVKTALAKKYLGL
jgi:hypothetical protein